MAPKMNEASGTDVFPHLIFCSIMIGMKQSFLTTFLKIKPPTFQVIEPEDAFEFIIDCYNSLHKMGIIKKHRVEFMIFPLDQDAKQWWRSYVRCRSLVLAPFTWELFHALFLEKYVPRTLQHYKKDDCLELEQGEMSTATYVAKFLNLYHHAMYLLTFEEDRIRHYVQGLNYDL